MEFSKTVKVTNPRNVLVQVPSVVVARWCLQESDMLEVQYSEETNSITIRPYVQGREDLTKQRNGLVSSTGA